MFIHRKAVANSVAITHRCSCLLFLASNLDNVESITAGAFDSLGLGMFLSTTRGYMPTANTPPIIDIGTRL